VPITSLLIALAVAAADPGGLWAAKRSFGQELRGSLTLERSGPTWTAEIAGRTAPVRLDSGRLSFEVPGGSFRGRLEGARLSGHWIQPATVVYGSSYATPVLFERRGAHRWRGTVAPLEDQLALYLLIRRDADGSLGAFLRNPERNLGRFLDVDHVSFEGRAVKLLGKRSRDAPETALLEGTYDADNDTLSIYLPSRGGTFDFHRATASDEARFFPRRGTPYSYRPPSAENDGWQVGDLAGAGISGDRIRQFIQMLIDMPIDSVHAPEIHGFLIARHGKLVLEEYFHGFHREQLHDTRSAAKSLTAVLVGATALRGAPIAASTKVFATMDGAVPAEARKAAMTIEHLLTMSAGMDCDDRDPGSPGNEDTMQEQSAQPDWYRYTLDLKMLRAPGEVAVYCSCQANLAGGVLARVTRRWLPDLFHELVAQPLQMGRYAMNLTPTGEAYMGGGVQFLPRDFMKLGQLMIDRGRWRGRQIVSADWTRKSITARYDLRGLSYGYLWWVIDLPYKARTVRAFFAGGNGGQMVMGVPELDLVIAFYAGNYSDPVMYQTQRVYVPEYVLPAIE
jgi:CubicO group peptidase (beta-lactamase class C family)